MDLVQAVMQSVSPQSRSSGARRLRKEQRRQLLAEAINGLSETERLVLGMRCLESVRPRQIAAVLELREEKIHELLENGMRRIQAHLSAATGPADAARPVRGRRRGGRAR
jgi:DNA-directed RNA polymerase specialized sigma24 family protein